MRTSVLFGVKYFGFFQIYGVPERIRGEEINFLRFCVDVLYGRPLKKILCGLPRFCVDVP